MDNYFDALLEELENEKKEDKLDKVRDNGHDTSECTRGGLRETHIVSSQTLACLQMHQHKGLQSSEKCAPKCFFNIWKKFY